MLENKKQIPDLIPLSRFNDYIPFPSVGALRILRFNNTGNFNEKVVRFIGKRIYIDVPALKIWVEENSKQQTA